MIREAKHPVVRRREGSLASQPKQIFFLLAFELQPVFFNFCFLLSSTFEDTFFTRFLCAVEMDKIFLRKNFLPVPRKTQKASRTVHIEHESKTTRNRHNFIYIGSGGEKTFLVLNLDFRRFNSRFFLLASFSRKIFVSTFVS